MEHRTWRTAHEQVVASLWLAVRNELAEACTELDRIGASDWSEARASWQAAKISELIAILDILDEHWKAHSEKHAPWDAEWNAHDAASSVPYSEHPATAG